MKHFLANNVAMFIILQFDERLLQSTTHSFLKGVVEMDPGHIWLL
jgi:hypothetical protein